MASPLQLFRRNQKIMLAVFGILIIFAFVFAGTLTQMQQRSGSGGRANPTIVEWDGGQLSRSELDSRKNTRERVWGFLDCCG